MNNLKWGKASACMFSVVACAALASAQMGGMGMRQAPPQGIFNPVVGAGAEYEITTSDGHKTALQYSIVGKESVAGKDGYWMEWTTSGSAMGQMVMKILIVPADPNAAPRMIMQMAGRPPMEMPSQMNRGAKPAAPGDIRGMAEKVGTESVTVPAGTFSCDHYRMKDGSGDTWVSAKVMPLGVVKHQGKDSTMVLTKVIADAKDKIVGKPVPFDPTQMMQQMQQHPPQQ